MTVSGAGLDVSYAALRETLRAQPDWPRLLDALAILRHAPRGEMAPAYADLARDAERAALALLLPPGHQGLLMSGKAFVFPAVISRFNGVLGEQHRWLTLKAEFEQALDTYTDAKSAGANLIGLMFVDAVLLGCATAVARFLSRLFARDAIATFECLPIPNRKLGAFLGERGWFDGDTAPIAETIYELSRAHTMSGAHAFTNLAIILARMFVTSEVPDPVQDAVYAAWLAPALQAAAKFPALCDHIAEIEGVVYTHYLRRHESEERFRRIYEEIGPALFSSGVARASAMNLRKPRAACDPQRSRPAIAFLLHNDSILAHTENLITFFRGLSKLDPQPIQPLVYLLDRQDKTATLNSTLKSLNIAVRDIASGGRHPMLATRTMALQDGVQSLVFVSLPLYLCFAAGYGIAPVLIWWSMKYHRLDVPGVDGYLTAGGFFEDSRRIGDRIWRSCRSALPQLIRPQMRAQADALRSQLGASSGTVILGCIGREVKMLGEGYLETVAELLKANPQCRLVWTGKMPRAAEITRRLRDLGVEPSTAYLGWLADTNVATQAIDVYVDSFPFASGHTAFEAMANGAPVVVLKTPEALETSVISGLVPVLEGRVGTAAEQADIRAIFTDENQESLATFADTKDQYVSIAHRLIRDAAYRRRAGAACRTFVERYAMNERRFAESTCHHIIDVMREAAS